MKDLKEVIVLLFIMTLFSCATAPPLVDRDEGGGKAGLNPGKTGETPVPENKLPPGPDYLTIVAAGDNLYHNVMILAGEEGDYEKAYSEIRPIVEKADIAFINQETLLGGKDFGFSGYPKFNSPQKLGQAIARAGFNVVNHASNHIMDKGEKAISATKDFWDNFPHVTVLGIHRSQEERARPKLIKKNNITAGLLSFTYGTNNLPLPAGKPYLVSLINTEIMAKEIDALRPLCDILIVSMHWGEEYTHECTKSQKELAAFLAEHKVDLVIGHHPHVIQPIEYIKRPDGELMLCFYSLGNLISAQSQNSTLLGALAYVKVEKTQAIPYKTTGSLSFKDAGAIPVVTHYEKGHTGFKVYPIYAYTEELAAKHWKNQTKKELTLDYLRNLASRIFGNKEIKQNPFE